jgi:hypothetical protein
VAGALLALALCGAGLFVQARWVADPHVSYDRNHLPAFDAYVYVAMAEQPRFFTVAPWGHRILTPWLASAIPVRNIARAFRIVTFTALLAAGGMLFLYLRALGHGLPSSVLGAGLFAMLPPVAECLRYVFLTEPLAVFLQVCLLLALQSGAGLGPLCLIAVLGTLAKEFFVLLVPVALVVGPRPFLPRAARAAVLFAVSLATAAALRFWWTPHLPAPLPAASPGTFLLALHRFHDSFPEWWRAALLAGAAPLAVIGSWRAAAAPVRSAALYVIALAVIPPFLNPVTFFSSDVPRLLIYTLPVVIPLAVCALKAPDSRAPRPDWLRRRGVQAATGALAVVAALGPLAIVDRYRRADLTGPRDGPYVLVVARETLRTARRLSRGEEVVLDPGNRRFSWGVSHPSEMDRMRWFLREGWGERSHYGTSDITMHQARGTVLLPVLRPADMTAMLHVQSPRPSVVDASVNGRPLHSWAVDASTGPVPVTIPGSILFRGDNLLTLAARDREPGVRLRGISYQGPAIVE